jgi:hypothetical protein
MVTAHPNGFIEPCIPTRAVKPPAGPDWVHEIKHATGCRSGATLCAKRGLRLECPLLGDRRHGGYCGSP